MDFQNRSNVAAAWTLGFEASGRELLVIAAKATFTIPKKPGPDPELAAEQEPLAMADTSTGEPGLSAPVYECDFAHRKPKCDVLILGSAHAPGGKEAERVVVSARVGTMAKSFAVAGNRVWKAGLLGSSPGPIEPFTVMPISYDNAFGGTDASEGEGGKVRTFLPNPVGRGYWYHRSAAADKPLPNTEEVNNPVRSPTGNYRPMAFGPIGRSWPPRVKYAGTYDEKWLNTRSPFWPDDFDYRYFQCAPEDQQIDYPRGGEEVVLENLSPQGVLRFRLPRRKMPVICAPQLGRAFKPQAVIDTVVIEPDKQRFLLTWRAAVPLRRNVFELRQVVVGQASREWRRSQDMVPKARFKNLTEYIRARRR